MCEVEEEFICPECGETSESNDCFTYIASEGHSICETCIEQYTNCAFCDEWRDSYDVATDYSGNTLCEDCEGNGRGARCDECEHISSCDYVHYCSDCSRNFCEDCDCGCSDGRLIRDYGSSPSCGMRFYSIPLSPTGKNFTRSEYAIDKNLYFGIEAETVFQSPSKRDTYLEELKSYCDSHLGGMDYLAVPQEDGSISRTRGVEIVFQPHTRDAFSKRLDMIPMPDPRTYLEPNEKAGCHVNMSREAFSDETWSKFVRFINVQAEAWRVWSGRSGNESYYSYDKYANPEQRERHPSDLLLPGNKYTAVNVQYKRLEVRTFLGDYTKSGMMFYINLCYNLAHFCDAISADDFLTFESNGLMLTVFEYFVRHGVVVEPFFLSKYDSHYRLIDKKNSKLIKRKVSV